MSVRADCDRCPRLRAYCQQVALEKRKAYRDQDYWGKPVPSFGDFKARLMVVGLAPGAHGANRTGRLFTGDQSGLWLYRAMARAGFANQKGFSQSPDQAHRDDGLQLIDAWMTNVIHCAPPDNKPLPIELEQCSSYLREEIQNLTQIRGFLVFGQVALKGLWKTLPEDWKPTHALPKFGHGVRIELNHHRFIWCSYHPSQQNTFTKKLTESMLDQIFDDVKKDLNKNY